MKWVILEVNQEIIFKRDNFTEEDEEYIPEANDDFEDDYDQDYDSSGIFVI